ncbi:MAG: hypothetical protein J6U30_07430 [Oscillospiraceae bacterium]|nr:hypothetical protein [Oscillospiraceae bacterium]
MSKGRKILFFLAALLILVLLVPFRYEIYRDGGTREYRALLYKVVVWNRLVEDDIYCGTDFYFFPDNFRSIDDLWSEKGID